MRKRIRQLTRIMLLTLALLSAATPMLARQGVQQPTVEQQAETLRAQLRDVTSKEAQLQERSRQLDEALKPENIERSVAGIGTTDAAALRDQRRQQLEREKASVDEQLRSLAASRSRLEASIASAEAEAVRLKAASLNANSAPRQTTAGVPASPTASKKPNTRRMGRRRHRRARRHRPR